MDATVTKEPTMKSRKIGVLMGGLSSERQISLETGQAVHSALAARGYDVHPVFVDRDIDLVLRHDHIDVAFIALHGRYGEDGCIQGMLEMLGIPYTGSDVLSSALAMNKLRAKQMFRLSNLPTAPYYAAPSDLDADEILARHGDFGYPVVVKPVGEGSSVGVSLVETPDELVAAAEAAACFDGTLLVERFIDGQEISVAIVGDRALGAVEIETRRDFYDYAAKYRSNGETSYVLPPRLSPERYRGVLNQALMAHRALGCSGATRADLIVSPTGNEYLLEVNTLPGLTPQSLLPKIALAAGLTFEDLVEAILLGARLHNASAGRRDRRIVQRPFAGEERRETGASEAH
jgi:D-alanine-D-alanine ligase